MRYFDINKDAKELNKSDILKGFVIIIIAVIMLNVLMALLLPATSKIRLISKTPNLATYENLSKTQSYFYSFFQGFISPVTGKKNIYESQITDALTYGADSLTYVTIPLKEIKANGDTSIKDCLIKNITESGISSAYVESCR